MRRPCPPNAPCSSAAGLLPAHCWVASGLIVLYVANSIAINNLVADITSLERERDATRNENEKLRAELLKLMAVERVSQLARARLGMAQPTVPPVLLQEPSAVVPPANAQATGISANQ
ncbi:MAG: Cell division protein FtsL [Chlorobi bacterium OLB7]|nr:MAG: Cell division protein FtsL [Chlorobi bacterium OLB7]